MTLSKSGQPDGIVTGIQRCSLHDGPGIRTMVFLKGCYLACRWCHNPETQSPDPVISFDGMKCLGCGGCAAVCPHGCHFMQDGRHGFDRSGCDLCGRCVAVCPGALEVCGERMTVDAVMQNVLADKGFYTGGGGMTLRGGEPFYQGEFALALLQAAKAEGIATAVETCGMAKTAYLEAAVGCTDVFLYDIKESSPARHRQFTGADNVLILYNLDRIASMGACIVLRAPIIPGVNDREEHFANIGAVAERYAAIRSVEVLPYHRAGGVKYANVGMTATQFAVPTPEDARRYVAAIAAHTNKNVKLA